MKNTHLEKIAKLTDELAEEQARYDAKLKIAQQALAPVKEAVDKHAHALAPLAAAIRAALPHLHALSEARPHAHLDLTQEAQRNYMMLPGKALALEGICTSIASLIARGPKNAHLDCKHYAPVSALKAKLAEEKEAAARFDADLTAEMKRLGLVQPQSCEPAPEQAEREQVEPEQADQPFLQVLPGSGVSEGHREQADSECDDEVSLRTA